jgi:hypothetical protein
VRVLTATLVWILTVFLIGCSHGEIGNLEYPLTDLKTVTQTFFNNSLVQIEDGGRDFKSEFFRPNLTKGRLESPRTEDNVRARAIVRFVGNERPYTIMTWVEVQTRDGNSWVDHGPDSKLSKKLAEYLSEFIRARKGKNFIDNYRAF